MVEAVGAEVRVVPFRQREVGAAAQGRLVRRRGVEELAEQIALGAVVQRGAVAGCAGVEEGEAVVVLGRDDEVLRPGVCEEVYPFFRVELRRGEIGECVVVGPIAPVRAQAVIVEV